MVSREPAKRRVRLSLSLLSSSCEMGRAPNTSRNSLLSSTRDSFVLSVYPGAVAARKLKRRASAIRPVLVLTQVHVYAPAERPAQYVVPDSQRNFLRAVARWCDRSRQDKRLRRARFIDQIHFGLLRRRYVRNALLRRIPLLPGRKSLFELRLNFRRRGVAHDHQRSVIRPVPRVVEFGDRVARQFADACFGQLQSIGMILAVKRRSNHAARHRAGGSLRPLNRGNLQLLLAREIFLRERRMEQHVGKQRERWLQLALQRGEINGRTVQPRTCLELCSQPLNLIADLQGVVLVRAAGQQRR